MHLSSMTHAAIINLWPTLSAFSDEIGVPYEAGKGMKRRGSIPAGYWTRVVHAAAARGFIEVTYQRLAEISAIRLEAAE